jgi:cytochrome c biogenesis protein CcmG/thiol:disulfide interchange protein DsbE
VRTRLPTVPLALRARLPTAVLALLALLWIGCDPPEVQKKPEADAPATAPGFSLPVLGGGELALEQLRGQPVILDFWATWCAPCVHQIPVLNAFHQRYGDRVAVLGISVDVRGEEAVGPFADEHEMAYRILLGDERLAQEYGAFGFPTLYVIGPDGVISVAHVGLISIEELEDALAPWLGTPTGA